MLKSGARFLHDSARKYKNTISCAFFGNFVRFCAKKYGLIFCKSNSYIFSFGCTIFYPIYPKGWFVMVVLFYRNPLLFLCC